METADVIKQVLMMVATGLCGWVFSKLQTRREQKQTDLQIINNAIKPLLESISDLTMRLKQMTIDLMDEREKCVSLSNERSELLGKIESLEKEVKRLSAVVKKLTTKDEKGTTDNP